MQNVIACYLYIFIPLLYLLFFSAFHSPSYGFLIHASEIINALKMFFMVEGL